MILACKRFISRAVAARRLARDARTTAFIAIAGTRLLRNPREKAGRFAFGDLSFEARASDWCAVEEVLLKREYEFVLPLLSGTSKPLVLDIGANMGSFAVFVLAEVPSASVFSVEPGSRTYEVLERNQRAVGGDRWTVRRLALAGRAGEARFQNFAVSSSSRLGDEGDELVPTATLDDIVHDAGGGVVDLLKVDVEGGEADAFNGPVDRLQSVRNVVIELHPDRCDVSGVVAALRHRYRNLYAIPGRASAKPLVLATDERCDLPPFELS